MSKCNNAYPKQDFQMLYFVSVMESKNGAKYQI